MTSLALSEVSWGGGRQIESMRRDSQDMNISRRARIIQTKKFPLLPFLKENSV